ncbi:hypothetical protein MXB_501 [Myxobolus squamalis]|nr:hypothetical protein MXB_501 [Myxobolus squamalis]
MEHLSEKNENINQDNQTAASSQQLEDSCKIEGNFEFVAKSFDDLNLKESITHGICSYGFSRPSPIQSRAIFPCIKGLDVIAQAQSGTGKTATFVIAALQRIGDTSITPALTEVLVISPTHELATQTLQVFNEIGQYTGAKSLTLLGGTKVYQDVENLKKDGAHVVVGTAGRVVHIVKKGSLDLSSIKMFILDEADQLLGRGFQDQIYELFKRMPTNIQVMLVSATMPDSVLELTKKFMNEPVLITVKKDQLTLQGIKQFYVITKDQNNKVDAIFDIMGSSHLPQMIIFVNSQKDAAQLCDILGNNGMEASPFHAGILPEDRRKVMKQFRDGNLRVLVATDVLARGIDVHGVALVVNFDLPRENETYLHRIGRSGRYGRTGIAINLIEEDHLKKVEELTLFYNTTISELPEDYKKFF